MFFFYLCFQVCIFLKIGFSAICGVSRDVTYTKFRDIAIKNAAMQLWDCDYFCQPDSCIKEEKSV